MHDGFPHLKRDRLEFGNSPGNGTTGPGLSREPLASEGEATAGPDDVNPFEDVRADRGRRSTETTTPDPTAGDDPYAFDDVADEVEEVDLPEPSLEFEF